VQSHDNGWVFCQAGEVDFAVQDLAMNAIKALGLDFGAVDVIIRRGKAYILEVNSAPGLEGRTLQAYVEAIKEYLNEQFANTSANNQGVTSVQHASPANRVSNSSGVSRQRICNR
jgi:predicted ATP-grasp superfamily ATP-dependent carboligase